MKRWQTDFAKNHLILHLFISWSKQYLKLVNSANAISKITEDFLGCVSWILQIMHSVKSVQLHIVGAGGTFVPTQEKKKQKKTGFFYGPYFSVFGLNTGKYGSEKTPYLDTFHAATVIP